MKRIFSQSGITAIELVVVIAIIGVLIAVVVLPLMTFRQQQALQNSTNGIVGVLNDARTKTLAAYNNTTYSVHIQSDKAVLFTGTTYSSSASANESFLVETSVTASWSLQGGGADISFDRLKGTTSQYGTITLTSSNGMTRTITVAASGTIIRN